MENFPFHIFHFPFFIEIKNLRGQAPFLTCELIGFEWRHAQGEYRRQPRVPKSPLNCCSNTYRLISRSPQQRMVKLVILY
jgi:hypothetical protein